MYMPRPGTHKKVQRLGDYTLERPTSYCV